MPTFELPERDPDDNSMSMERFEEIAEAENNGTPLDLTEEELAEYESMKQDLADLRETLAKATKLPDLKFPQFPSIKSLGISIPKLPTFDVPKPKGIDIPKPKGLSMPKPALPDFGLTPPKPSTPAANAEVNELQSKLSESLQQQRHQLARFTEPSPINVYEEATESILAANEEKAKAEAERVEREILQTTALQALVQHSDSQKASLESLVKDSQGQGKINKAVVWIGGATLAVSAIAAILAGIALTGDDQPAEVPPSPAGTRQAP